MDKNLKGKEILKYFPMNIQKHFEFNDNSTWNKITNIRINSLAPIIIEMNSRRYYLTSGSLQNSGKGCYIITRKDISLIFELITASSVFTYSRYINNGYITLNGANRVGIAGNCVIEENKIKSVNDIYSLNFRISHEINGVAEQIAGEIFEKTKIKNTLIISPPGCGKTTLLRDIARLAGNGESICGAKICAVIDERYEIACAIGGISQFDVGINNIIMSGCPKEIAVPIVVRTMAPDAIIVDEMCTPKDYKAALFAKDSGCSIIASVHGIDEKANELKNILGQNFFETVIVLSKRKGVGTIEKIIGGM